MSLILLLLWATVFSVTEVQADSFSEPELSLTLEQQELQLKDSIIVAQDRFCRELESRYKDELYLEQEKSANWDSSFATIKKEYEVCSKALFITSESLLAKEAAVKESSASKAVVGAYFLGGVAVGAFLFYLFF